MPYPSDINDSWDHFYDDEEHEEFDPDEFTRDGWTTEEWEDYLNDEEDFDEE